MKLTTDHLRVTRSTMWEAATVLHYISMGWCCNCLKFNDYFMPYQV